MQRCGKRVGGEMTDFFRKKTKGKKGKFHWQISESAVHCEKQFEYKQCG